MKQLRRLILLCLLSIFLIGMNSCTTVNVKHTKEHPVFKVHPKNNGKKKGHTKHKHKQKHKKGKKHKH